jgi:hypothetical protein
VNAVAPTSTASEAPTIRCQYAGSQPSNTRSVIRNHMPAETALQNAAIRLIRWATLGAIGSSETTWPSSTNSGLPGGCGIPST